MQKLNIREDFKSLIPPLPPLTFEALEQDILERGIIDPLKTWRGFIIDGHHRYQIAEKYNLDFNVIDMTENFTSDVMVYQWMIRNQLSRRNLRLYERAVLSLKYMDILRKLLPNEQETIRKETAARLFNVSVSSVDKCKAILSSKNEKFIKSLQNEERSLNEIYIKYLHWKEKQKEENPVLRIKQPSYLHNMSCFEFMKQTDKRNKFNVVITEPYCTYDPQIKKKFTERDQRIGYCANMLDKVIKNLLQIVTKECAFFFIIDPDDWFYYDIIRKNLTYASTLVYRNTHRKNFEESYKLINNQKNIVMCSNHMNIVYCTNSNSAELIKKNTFITDNDSIFYGGGGVPIPVIDYILSFFDNKEITVFDPFAGYGSTVAACLMNNVQIEACELDTDVYNEAITHIEKFRKTL